MDAKNIISISSESIIFFSNETSLFVDNNETYQLPRQEKVLQPIWNQIENQTKTVDLEMMKLLEEGRHNQKRLEILCEWSTTKKSEGLKHNFFDDVYLVKVV